MISGISNDRSYQNAAFWFTVIQWLCIFTLVFHYFRDFISMMIRAHISKALIQYLNAVEKSASEKSKQKEWVKAICTYKDPVEMNIDH